MFVSPCSLSPDKFGIYAEKIQPDFASMQLLYSQKGANICAMDKTTENAGGLLRHIRKHERDITLEEMSDLCGVDTGNLSRIERGLQDASLDTLERILKALQIRPHEFFLRLESSGGVLPAAIPTSPGDTRLPIRRVKFRLSATITGFEVEYETGDSEPIFMCKRWFDQNHFRPDNILAIRVSGRSMEPSLHDGDLIFINTEDTILRDGVAYAANYDGELVIKRLKRESGQWFLASDNPDKIRFADKICGEGCGLIGRVVYVQSEHI